MSKKPKEADKSEADTEPDPFLYFGYGGFVMPNGDCYVGNYCAHKFGYLWREGHGIYITKDDHMYEADWQDDKIVEDLPTFVMYPNGACYYGCIKDNNYEGPGVYILENKLLVSCNFVESIPVGEVTLIDNNGRLWRGTAGEETVYLNPENHFEICIPKERGIGELKEKSLEIIAEETPEEVPEDLNELEHRFFKKSAMMENDFSLGDSVWARRYISFLKKRKSCCLFNNNDWCVGYSKFLNLPKKKPRSLPGIDNALMERFLSLEHRKGCEAVSVFYPSCLGEQSMEMDDKQTISLRSMVSESSIQLREKERREQCKHEVKETHTHLKYSKKLLSSVGLSSSSESKPDVSEDISSSLSSPVYDQDFEEFKYIVYKKLKQKFKDIDSIKLEQFCREKYKNYKKSMS